MKKQSKCDCKRSKHQINEYTLISSDRTEPMCWVLEDVDSIPYNILENESNINPIIISIIENYLSILK